MVLVAGWLGGRLGGLLACWVAGSLAGWRAAGWLASLLADWLAGWTAFRLGSRSVVPWTVERIWTLLRLYTMEKKPVPTKITKNYKT